jgi:hypothetical protein
MDINIEESDHELIIKKIIDVDLDLDDNNQTDRVGLFLDPGSIFSWYVVTYILELFAEEVKSMIHDAIRDKGLETGLQLVAFEMFKLFYEDKNKLDFAEQQLPTFLNYFKKYANIFPESSASDHSNSGIIIEKVKEAINATDKPFKVDVNEIIKNIIAEDESNVDIDELLKDADIDSSQDENLTISKEQLKKLIQDLLMSES